ncbi:MAG: hypothetical protein ACOY0T_16430 [Myxococcota bacterium]
MDVRGRPNGASENEDDARANCYLRARMHATHAARRGWTKRAGLLVALPVFFASPCFADVLPASEPHDPSARFELDWLSPPACDARERTLEALQRLLQASPRELATSPLTASASVTRTATGGWHLLLTTTHAGQQLTRKLEATSCDELSDAAALILALVLDPELLTRPSSTPATSAEASGPSEATSLRTLSQPRKAIAPAPPVSSAPPVARPSPPLRALPLVELGPLAAWGALPSPAFGVSLTGGFDLSHWRWLITGSYFPGRRASLAGTNGSASFELRTLAATVCWLPEAFRNMYLGPCVTSEFGSIAARPEGVDFPSDDTKRWGASGAGVLLRFASRRAFEFGLQSSLLVPWGRPEFRLAGSILHQPAALTLQIRGFLGVRF